MIFGCVPRPWDFPSGSSFFFLHESVFGGGLLSSQIEETSEKKRCTSIVARVNAVFGTVWSSSTACKEDGKKTKHPATAVLLIAKMRQSRF